ncbi:DNA polymerase beta superfamily protein [Heliorestis convoluta]|uniref:Nucleotidyltransferase n=1 Tax=Heliorestis convoluta TaxID=356322 RepID=A0A5Q2N883_9FIRM|nr:nucleotidyltransferase domain-containing protein [Heliorestis convoluta]QGG48705.1 hypothetical protein FTV88_2612 [Heliorestis convoluta]
MEQSFDGRSVVIAALVGSPNYNLKEANSDEDWKYLVSPSFDDLYDGTYYTQSHNSPERDFTVHDIRRFCQLLGKGNPYFLEILFSIKVYATPRYHDLLEQLIEKREKLASMNRPGLYRACIGHSKEKIKNLRKGTATTKDAVAQKGYDTKEALHAYRLLDLLERYYHYEWDFGRAIWYPEEERGPLLALKSGAIDNKEIDCYLQEKVRRLQSLERYYNNELVQIKTKKWLEEKIRLAVLLNFLH